MLRLVQIIDQFLTHVVVCVIKKTIQKKLSELNK